MAEIKEVVEELRQLKHCLTKKCDITCSYYNAEDMICPCGYDVSSDVTIDNAIQTIRELQELNKGLSETYTSNSIYEIGYKKGASDMEKAKQIIIDKLKEQIPKWHYCNGEFPKESGYYLVAYHEWTNGDFLPKYDDTRVCTMHFQNSEQYVGWNYPMCCDERAEKDTYREVIAWSELPKFEESEE